MIVRGLTSTGDWAFGKGVQDYKSGLAAVAQNVQTRVLSFRGDCFFAVSDNIDWFNLLGGKDETAISLAVGGVILGTAFVSGVKQLSISLAASRVLSISYNAQTVLGATGQQQFQFDLPIGG